MIRRRDLVVVIALVALAATASFLLLSGEPDEAATAPRPPETSPAAAPVKGVRADAASRRVRRPAESPAADTAPKGPTGSLLVRVKGSGPTRSGLAPLEGAAVYVIDATDADWRAVTAEAGSARFEDLPAGATVVRVETSGRKAVERKVVLKAGEEETVDVLAFRVGTLRGIVRDPDGRPADTAWVHLANAVATDVVTNDDGSFEITDAPCGGSFTLTAGAPEWADAEPIEGIRLEGEPPAATRDVVLRRLSSVVLRIVDPSGHPVDAKVWVDGPSVDVRHRGTGEYVRDRIAPGAHTVTASSDAFPKATRSFTVAAGASADVEVRFEAGAAIEGLVVDAAGAPVPNAYVIVGRAADAADRIDAIALSRQTGRMTAGSEPGVATGADGTFRLGRLTEGDYTLSAATESAATAEAVGAHAPATGVRLVFAPLTRVSFRLVRTEEESGSFTVTECAAGAAPNRAGTPLQRFSMRRGLNGRETVVTQIVSPGATALWICADVFAPVVVPFTPRPGELTDLGDVRVEAGLSLRGRVVGTDGKPVRGAQVVAPVGSLLRPRAVSADDGTFALEHLAPGPVVVRAAADALLGVAVLDVRRDAPPGDVVVRAPGVVHGTVRNADGTAAVSVEVAVRHAFADASDDAFEVRAATSGAEGRFKAVVAAGRCLVSAGGAWVRADVAEGGEASVTLEKP
jgi:hypothetical protein